MKITLIKNFSRYPHELIAEIDDVSDKPEETSEQKHNRNEKNSFIENVFNFLGNPSR